MELILALGTHLSSQDPDTLSLNYSVGSYEWPNYGELDDVLYGNSLGQGDRTELGSLSRSLGKFKLGFDKKTKLSSSAGSS